MINAKVKVSDLCNMIEHSVQSGRYPFDSETQKKLAQMLKVTNKSDCDDLEADKIEVETRVGDLYVLNNYTRGIKHLPGVIELDVLDSFKMICRKLERTDSGMQINKL